MPRDFDLVRSSQIVYRNDNIVDFVSDINQMDLDNRILHLIVSQEINPKDGNFTMVSQEEICIMCQVIEKKPPSLCGLIVKKMLDAVKWSKMSSNTNGIPYGKLVLMMCREKCIIPEDAVMENRDAMAPFKDGSLMKMGYNFDKATKT